MTEQMRLLCDEMLLRLGKWLRAAGYDTAIAARGEPDEGVVALAEREQRVLLTCDRRMLPLLQRADVAYLLLPSSRARDALPWLREVLGLDVRFSPWSRCLKCNVPLQDIARADVDPSWRHRVPRDGALFTCPTCHQIFWEGSHVRRLDERLGAINAEASLTRR